MFGGPVQVEWLAGGLTPAGDSLHSKQVALIPDIALKNWLSQVNDDSGLRSTLCPINKLNACMICANAGIISIVARKFISALVAVLLEAASTHLRGCAC